MVDSGQRRTDEAICSQVFQLVSGRKLSLHANRCPKSFLSSGRESPETCMESLQLGKVSRNGGCPFSIGGGLSVHCDLFLCAEREFTSEL